MSFQLRPYQIEAVEAVHEFVCTQEGNPAVSLPTGSGKSVVMAALLRKWREESPWIRACVLAHRRELVLQNSEKFHAIYPDCEMGIFSAGLGKRDYKSPILFASIDSVYKKSGEFQPFDVIMVDEAHRIPPSGEGKYRTFIAGCKRFNKNLKVIGWTATPFRMGCGDICYKDHILTHLCYDARVTDLIKDGYLCNLRSKVGEHQPELSEVKRNSGGDYKLNSLAEATNNAGVVWDAVSEAVRIMNSECRRAAVFFTVDINHCKMVHQALKSLDVNASYIIGKTHKDQRDAEVQRFKDGRTRAICNVNVLTEGFDSPHIDCIVLLRPTLSPGLYCQMVGRGLRPHASKTDCLVLDFANCIEEHGPIDLLGGEPVVMAVCQECRESFSRAVRVCPKCGWKIPKQEIERLGAAEAERKMHGKDASKKSILSDIAEVHKVNAVYVTRHRKKGKPDSLRVSYRCGLSMFREWVCFNHEGYAGQKAREWWRMRFGRGTEGGIDEALGSLFFTQELLEWTKTITVKRGGKHISITGYNEALT